MRPDDELDETEASWVEATMTAIHPVFRVCMGDAAEQAGFLEFVFRMAGRPFDVVDATGLDLVTVRGVRTPLSLGQMCPDDIVASGPYARRRPPSPAEIAARTALWSRLRREDAPLRIVRGGEPASAPLIHFDARLASQATRDWEVAAELIGRALASTSSDADQPSQGPNHIVLFGRVLALGESGRLDVTGPGPGMRDFAVRRAGGR